MTKGSQPTDGGNLLLNKEEKDFFDKKYPEISPYIKRYMGANDLINNIFRYCFWLKKCPPNLIRAIPELKARIDNVKESRLQSTKIATQRDAERPTVFTEDRQPDTDYIILPVVSSQNRKYIPTMYVSKEVIANANAQMIPGGNLYTFGIINSSVHNSWMRTVCGRMKSDYAYSASIVYNNFIWPEATEQQKDRISQTAQEIIDARTLYPESSLADLYDTDAMPIELRKAHKANDKAVLELYGFKPDATEEEIVAKLMQMYSEKVQEEKAK